MRLEVPALLRRCHLPAYDQLHQSLLLFFFFPGVGSELLIVLRQVLDQSLLEFAHELGWQFIDHGLTLDDNVTS